MRFDSFFIGSYEDKERAISFTVTDLFNNATIAMADPVVGAAGFTAMIGATSSVGFRIIVGPDGYNGGINDIVFTAVPAPPALALFGMGVLGLGLVARRRAAV